MEEVSVCDNKYTVRWGPGTPLHALRYGEEWRDCTGDGLILALAQEIQELRQFISDAFEAHSNLDLDVEAVRGRRT